MTAAPAPPPEDWVLEQIEALALRRGAPVLAVDADEVLVRFAEHLAEYVEGHGWRLDLTEFRLDGAFVETGTGRVGSLEEGWDLIAGYFRDEVLRQQAIDGAAEALGRLSRDWRVVVLTNVPRFAREPRIENLAGLGMDYPVVANAGGKGRALRAISDMAGAPVVFVDDSPQQHQSAARRSPETTRVHFVGSPLVRRIAPRADAHHHPESWAEIEALLV